MKKEFDVQSDIEMPRIYKKYITEQQPPVNLPIEKTYNKSKLFILSHDVPHSVPKPETAGVLKSVFGMFGKKAESSSSSNAGTIDKLFDEVTPEETEKLEALEKAWDVEGLYKGVQDVIAKRARDQNEITKLIYTIKIGFCENHVALSNAIRSIIVILLD